MCGRYAIRSSVPELARVLEAEWSAATLGPAEDSAHRELAPCYNIAPTRRVPVLQAIEGVPVLCAMRWGLVPHWSNGPDARWAMHNARIESVTSKPAYRAAIRHQRCLIPASGWYEWQSVDGRKQPWLITHREFDTVCFAGLWDRWHRGGQTISSCTILTAAAQPPIDTVHNRMPIVVPAEARASWMDTAVTDATVALQGLRPLHARGLQALPVSTYVNNAKNNDPRCMEPLQLPD